MEIVRKRISLSRLRKLSKNMFNLVKAVVDVEKRIMVVDAEMHADEEMWLLEHESKQSDLWGINLYPEKYGTDDFLEFDSMINLRPNEGNLSRGVEDEKVRELIKEIVGELVVNE